MIRNLKALGLALVAAFALTAVTASAASAAEGVLTSASGNAVTLQGEDNGVNRFVAFGNTVECPESTYTGHEANSTPHEPVPNKATAITVTPHYLQAKEGTANCDVNEGEFSATITMNGCDYTFDDFTTTGEVAGTYGFTADINCNNAGPIIIHTYLGHGHAFELCTVTIPQQSGLTGAHATDTGNGTVDLEGTITGIEATQDESTFCAEETTTTATYTVHAAVTGENEAEEQEGISISDE